MRFLKVINLALILFIVVSGLLISKQIDAREPAVNESFQLKTTLNALLGNEDAQRYSSLIKVDEPISWQVYLPANDSKEIPGLFVYISPMKTGRIDSRWRKVMDQQNLIYIAANDSGNTVPVNRRMVFATLAIRALGQQQAFRTERIYVSGYSGGGRVASKLASQYPEVFSGALYICGVDFWKKGQTPKVERLIQNRFVFFSGSRDFNLRETKKIYRRYLKAGAQHSKLLVISGLGHLHPDANALTEAIQFLDGK